MNLWGKIRLSGKFGKATYVISAIITSAMVGYVVFYPTMASVCFLLKLFSLPSVWYLRSVTTKGLAVYFYLNLGISRREYWLVPIVVEFVAFVVLMIAASIIGHAIG